MKKQNFIIFITFLLLLTSCEIRETEIDSLIITESIASEKTAIDLTAGQAFTLDVCNDVINIDEVSDIYLIGFSQNRSLAFDILDDHLAIKIESDNTKNIGSFTIEALLNKKLVVLSHLLVKAGEPHGMIPSFVGPKTINFGSDNKSMITAFPVDEYNNPTSLKETMKFQISTGQENEIFEVSNKETYAFLDFTSMGSEKLIIGGKSGDGNTIEQSVRSLTGCPEKISVGTSQVYPVADGRQFFKVTTGILKDSNNDIIENGTVVTIVMKKIDNQQISKYRSIAVNGIGTAWIRNPIYSGDYEILVNVCEEWSSIVGIHFSELITEFNYSWEGGMNSIRIGPISSVLNQYVPNGTPLIASFDTTDGTQSLSTSFYNGFADIDISKLWIDKLPESAVINIYGKTYKINKSCS